MRRETFSAYVSGALTGLAGEDHRQLYETAAATLRDFRFDPYLPHLATDPILNPDVEPSVVYDIDRGRVANADLLVAFVSRPSLGVGMELEIAGQALVPIVPIYRSGAPISRMALGGLAKVYGPVVYSSLDDLRSRLTALMNVVVEDLQSRYLPQVPHVGERIRQLRESIGLTSAQLALALGLSNHHVALLEEAPPTVSNPSLVLLSATAQVLGVELSRLLGEELLATSRVRDSLQMYAAQEGLTLDEYRKLEQAALRAVETDRPLTFYEWGRMREARMLAAVGAEQLPLIED